MTDIENEIVAKGLTAPRITPADIEANIAETEIVKHVSTSGQVLRWAVLTTRNGFSVAGKPSCSASSANDNQEIGEKIAVDNARQELWPLMGYALKERLSQGGEPKITAYTAYDVASYETDPHRHMTVFKFKDGTSYALNMDTIDGTDEHVLSIAARKHTQATGGKKP